MRKLRVLKNKRLKQKLLDEVFLQNQLIIIRILNMRLIVQFAKMNKYKQISVEKVGRILSLSEDEAREFLVDMCKLNMMWCTGWCYALTDKEL